MKRELTKKEILHGKFLYPKDLITLRPTNHCLERIKERGQSLDILPSVVRITESNLQNGKTKDEKSVTSVVIKLDYTSRKDMYLCFNPFDGALKTVWYGNRQKFPGKKNTKRTV